MRRRSIPSIPRRYSIKSFKRGKFTDDINSQNSRMSITLYQVFSYQPASITCFVNYCEYIISPQVKFIESVSKSNLSEHIKGSRYQYVVTNINVTSK